MAKLVSPYFMPLSWVAEKQLSCHCSFHHYPSWSNKKWIYVAFSAPALLRPFLIGISWPPKHAWLIFPWWWKQRILQGPFVISCHCIVLLVWELDCVTGEAKTSYKARLFPSAMGLWLAQGCCLGNQSPKDRCSTSITKDIWTCMVCHFHD